MGRGLEFSAYETEILVNNYKDMTIVELQAELKKQGYNRSRKSINRKLEKLREDDEIEYRNKKTINRAYRQRRRKEAPTQLEDVPSFDTGFGWGQEDKSDKPSWGDSDADWGSDGEED